MFPSPGLTRRAMTEIRLCWAHNIAGDRCGKRASHKGNHSITVEWDDSKCAEPNVFTQVPVKRELAPPPPPIPEAPVVDTTQCVACSHRHVDGPCKCGCYEFIG